VYYQGGDYKSAANLTTSNSVVFDNVQNVNTSDSFGNAAIRPVFPTTSATAAGSTGGQFAAVLTNGNIVQAFVNTGPTPGTGTTAASVYFQVVNTSGVVQVAPTRVGTNTVTNSFTVNVVALTGGGFAVVFIDNSGVVSYAIYTNTGALTTALTTDTGIGSSTAKRLEAVALANGGFAVATVNTSTNHVATRAYGATGTPAYAWTTTSVQPASPTSPFGLSSRSDSSTIVAFVNSGTVTVQYFLYNSAGGSIISGSFAVGSVTPGNISDVICLADGTTYVIGYFTIVSGVTVPAFRLLSSLAPGAETTIPSANFNSGTGITISYSQIALLAQASGGFMLAFADNSNAINYAFYNASGTILSGANPIVIPTARACRDFAITLIEISGFVNMYWTVGIFSQAQSNPNQSFVQINSTTYALVPQTSTASTVLSTAAVPAGTAVTSAATPTRARFFPATTTTNTTTRAVGAVVVAPTIITSTACNGLASCTLPNGQFVIAYKLTSSPFTVFASVYSPSGVLITTITVGTGVTTAISVKVAALSSGKFVVGWATGSAVSLNLYSSTFTQIGTTQSVTLGGAFSTNSINFDLAGLGGNTDRYVVAYVNSFSAFVVYDNTNTAVVTNTNASNGNGVINLRLAADNVGGFAISNIASTIAYIAIFSQTNTNTYSVTSTLYTTFTSSASSGTGQLSSIYANNGYYQAVNNTATNVFGLHFPINSTSTTNVAYGNLPNAIANQNTMNSQALGLNGNGHVIYVSWNTALLTNFYVLFGGVGSAASSDASTTTPVNNTTLSISSAAGTGGGYSICPSLGNNFVLAWLDASNLPTFAIYNSLALTTSFTTTAGVTQSNVASIQPTQSTANSTVPNTILAGVAVTGAAAASTGQVAINGLAQLNSSYPSGTVQAFDYTGQAIGGVKGVINGRVVNMQGNT
jgi:hypothetical protein